MVLVNHSVPHSTETAYRGDELSASARANHPLLYSSGASSLSRSCVFGFGHWPTTYAGLRFQFHEEQEFGRESRRPWTVLTPHAARAAGRLSTSRRSHSPTW